MADVVDRRAFDPFAPPPRDPRDPLTPPAPPPGRHPAPPEQGGTVTVAATGTATVEPSDGPGPTRDDLDDLSKTELQQRADELGLRTYGTKAELIDRIREAQATAG